jgi:hypothetical protein
LVVIIGAGTEAEETVVIIWRVCVLCEVSSEAEATIEYRACLLSSTGRSGVEQINIFEEK